MVREIRIGMVGYKFMGRAHSNAFSQAAHFFNLKARPILKVVCGRHEAEVKKFAGRWGYQDYETDWRRLVERDDVDLVDISTPNNTHAEIAIAAARNGKAVFCEKPLASNVAEAEKMLEAVRKNK